MQVHRIHTHSDDLTHAQPCLSLYHLKEGSLFEIINPCKVGGSGGGWYTDVPEFHFFLKTTVSLLLFIFYHLHVYDRK